MNLRSGAEPKGAEASTGTSRKRKELMCSVGAKPTEVKVRSLVAWIEGERETKLSSIDKAIFRMVSALQARLTECLDVLQQAHFFFAIRLQFVGIQKSLDQRPQTVLRKDRDGGVHHQEEIVATHPANGSTEFFTINLRLGHGFPQLSHRLLSYSLSDRRMEDRDWAPAKDSLIPLHPHSKESV